MMHAHYFIFQMIDIGQKIWFKTYLNVHFYHHLAKLDLILLKPAQRRI